MATEYRLTLAGSTLPVLIAERALPEQDERPTGTPQLLAADLSERYGFEVTVRAGQNGYFDAETDTGMWEWEPAAYVAVTFRLDKDAEPDRAVGAMMLIVRRLLQTGPEDAALVLNGNWLLMSRFGGVLVKHRRDKWWKTYAAADDLIEERGSNA
ncbi:SitI3 family protein [Actinoplanes sp. CA-051413]|uniref:SitI3 family protein n=1 Tax=Actinoplanes sp. CA-051413 TaxID=3239899 RepID=UPI003D99C864